MKKTDMIAYLESIKKVINNDLLVEAIFESHPDIMELDINTPEGGVYDISDKNENEKSDESNQRNEKNEDTEVSPVESPENNENSDKQDKADEESESVAESNKQLTIINDAGSKQVAYDDAFKNVNDKSYATISDLFTPEVVKIINDSDDKDWKEVDRRMIMCNESDYKSSKTKMNCYNSSNPTGLGRPNIFSRHYIDKYYTANQVGKLKDANKRFIIFTASDMSEPIHILDISPKQNGVTYAIKSKIASEENPYLMKGSKLHTNFLFKEASND